MGYRETSPKPSPDQVVDVVGGTFGVGFVFGGALHFLKGIYNSPGGARLAGAAQAIRINSPRVGGRFAAWGGLFSTFDCTLEHMRQKEDPWNQIIAGAAAGGFRQMRQGFGATARSAAVGGVLLAPLGGFEITMDKFLEQYHHQHWYVTEEPGASMPGLPGPEAVRSEGSAKPEAVGSEGSSSGGSWFGKGKESEAASSGSETKVLESFDAPPVQGFEIKVTWRAD
ncbi:mitochondrial import inner membrane translocase subunit TIM17-1-like [Rosa rugosa]|uniref:mitochondrial import inner membrane translocase subunit TIM17-1-like n=1 Tax=Rosa rugosa TaxID=74645 RepID=UPI002B413F9B|nr:mitochondrial import inner membrane translocase subunit TIM17-1-like [Rosa rugosa]